MGILFTILILMLVVSLSQIATRMLPFQVPVPLVQIIIGALLAWPDILHVDLDPNLFLVLFIPPLLFSDGRKTAVSEFVHNLREIIGLALVLVILTIIGVGYLTYILIPDVSLPAAFALAAAISPTDPVALSGIIGEGKFAKKKMAVIHGEALLNDASGLVAFKFAILVAIGAVEFHIIDASVKFLEIAIGGLLVGFTISWLYSRLLRLMSRWTDDDPATQIVLIVLLPFAAYLTAEHFDVSGILAVVSAGMTINRESVIRKAPLTTRLRSSNAWTTLTYVFNGIIFIILGLQLPGIFTNAFIEVDSDPHLQKWHLFTFVVVVYFALMLTRFIWLWTMKILSLTLLKMKPSAFANYSNRDLLICTFAGVRGAITLAGILSIPFYINITPFPSRHTLIFIAAGVILMSIIGAVITLPLLLRGTVAIDKSENIIQEKNARGLMAKKGIITLQRMRDQLINSEPIPIAPEVFDEINSRVIASLKRHINPRNNPTAILEEESLERRMRLIALNAERTTLYQLSAKNEINQEVVDKILYDIDLLETVLTEKG